MDALDVDFEKRVLRTERADREFDLEHLARSDFHGKDHSFR